MGRQTALALNMGKSDTLGTFGGKHLPFSSIELLHLNSTYPLWKILERCTTGGVCISSRCAHLAFLIDIITPSAINLIYKSPKGYVYLKIHSPVWYTLLKSSTGGVWIINGVAQIFASWKEALLSKTKKSRNFIL